MGAYRQLLQFVSWPVLFRTVSLNLVRDATDLESQTLIEASWPLCLKGVDIGFME